MTQIDSYLDAVRRLLPRQTRDDVVAELRDALLTEIEANQQAHGRPLTRAEIAGLLSRFGAPHAVAARYGAERYLVGPRMYPFFLFVAKGIALLIGVIALIRIVIVAFTAEDPVAAVAGVVIPAFVMTLLWVALAAVVLSRVEELPIPPLPSETWIPCDRSQAAPVVPQWSTRSVVPRRETVSSLAGLTSWLLGWTGVLPLGEWMLWRWLPIAPTPVWTDLRPFVIGLLAAGIAADLIVLVQPRLARFYRATQVATACALLALIGLALRGWPLVLATVPGASAASAARVTNIVLVVILAGLAVISIACLVTIVRGWIDATPPDVLSARSPGTR